MSSSRTLTQKLAWTDELRSIELLDWETQAEDFECLYQDAVDLLLTRTQRTREQLHRLISEEALRGEVRMAAERFEEKYMSLRMFIYMWLRFHTLPQASKRGGGR